MVTPSNNIPTVLVAFGATGDLMRVKVVPALFRLHLKNELPQMFRVYGFSRRDLDDVRFREHIRENLANHAKGVDAEVVKEFLSMFYFQKGQFDEMESYETLKKTIAAADVEWSVCANKLFYLSVAPEFYVGILARLASSGLTDPCSPEEGWTRVIVEKPFGEDYESARKLDELLGKLFEESQIYRIDHYLAKEMLQNILTFRFSNNLFELNWDKDFIEKIEMRLLEEIGVEKRGPFYDSVGALRDVGQNHLLQMLALITMEHPLTFDPDNVRPKRAEILHKLKVPTKKEVATTSFRAQYKGYRDIAGVAPGSETETYFRVRAEIDSPRWKGVPIYMEAGKRLGAPLKEMRILFKHPTPCLCPPGMHHKNEVIIRMEPKEEILIEFWAKKPGFSMDTEPRMFHFPFRDQHERMQYTEEYERLLLDCIRGDQTLFISTEEIRAMWRFTDPIVAAWRGGAVPMEEYEPGKKEVTERAANK